MELLHYCRHISNLDQQFHWVAILSYDAQFRHKCALHNLPLSTFDQQLYVTILDATVTKAAACRCFQCQCYDHEVIDCPFPPGGPLEKEAHGKEDSTEPAGPGKFLSPAAAPQQQGHGLSASSSVPPRQRNLHQVPVCIMHLPQLQKGPCLQAL